MEQLQFGSILPVDRPESSGASFAASTAASDAGSGAAVAEAVSLDCFGHLPTRRVRKISF